MILKVHKKYRRSTYKEY